jgi:hypothetical protein
MILFFSGDKSTEFSRIFEYLATVGRIEADTLIWCICNTNATQQKKNA